MRLQAILSSAVLSACFAVCLSACGTDPHRDSDTLELKDAPVPSPFRVGDTSGLWTAARTVVLATGKTETTDPYNSFHLVSSDTAIVGVVNGRFVVGRAAGSAEVSAEDDKSNLTSESSIKVVVAEP